MTATMSDRELLQAFARQKSAEAFQELVRRHARLVYGSARQRVGDPHAAEDITQSVFLALATKAPTLPAHTILTGWLYRVTRYTAIDYLRREQHRREREMTAHETQQLDRQSDPAAAALWQEISPHLPAALDGLSDTDRNTVLLRFYQQNSYAEIAEVLRVSPDSARKRVDRAVDRLRRFLGGKGIRASAGGLVTALGVGAAEAVPAAVIQQATQAALAAGSGGTIALITTGGIAIMSTKLKIAAGAAIVCLLAGGIWFAVQWTTPPPVDLLPTPAVQPSRPATVTEPLPPPARDVLPSPIAPRAGSRSLILRLANPPMEVTDSRGRRYVAKKIEDLKSLPLWVAGMNIGFVQAFRLTAAEQIRLQQLWDTLWQGGDAYGTMFDIAESNEVLVVKWKGDVFLDAYRSQRQQVTSQLLTGACGILGDERAEVLGWLPQVGNIHYVNLLPDPNRPIGQYQFTVSATNINGLIVMRYFAKNDRGSVSGQDPGLGPWPALGEQLGVPRQTVLNNLAAQRQKATENGYIQYRDPAEPLDNAPIAAEDTVTGQRYLYQPAPAR
jgi:RNA polymerase sigma factor (sigma-70 family)